MMKHKQMHFLVLILILGISSCQVEQNRLTKKEVWLFNGSSTDAWRSLSTASFPEQGWNVSGNELTVMAAKGNILAGMDIVTKKQYSNFILELDFKLTTHANSGVKYFVNDKFPGYEGNYLGMEYQILDDESYTIEEMGSRYGNHKTGSLYDLIPAPEDKKLNPPGEWNSVKILVDGKHVEHWLNGKKMLEYERGSDAFQALVAKSKYHDLKDFGEAARGYIMLQGHNGEVSYRSIKITTW